MSTTPRRTRRALATVAALGMAAGGLALTAPAASAQDQAFQVVCGPQHTEEDYLAGLCTGFRYPTGKAPRRPTLPPAQLGLFEIPDQPAPVADALAGAVRVANDLHPEDPFVFVDVAGPTAVIGYSDEEQGYYRPTGRLCHTFRNGYDEQVPCPSGL